MEQQYSDWVMKNFVQVSKMLGASFMNFEERILSLIQEMENSYVGNRSVMHSNGKSNRKQEERGSRELKRLRCSVNYEDRNEKRKDGGGVCMKLN